jgi:hypothetical protein
MAHFGEQYDIEYHKKRAQKFAVLGHLRLNSPKQWDALYLHFKLDRDAEIEAILKDLRDNKYIEVGNDRMVRITASGRKHLEEQFLRGL